MLINAMKNKKLSRSNLDILLKKVASDDKAQRLYKLLWSKVTAEFFLQSDYLHIGVNMLCEKNKEFLC